MAKVQLNADEEALAMSVRDSVKAIREALKEGDGANAADLHPKMAEAARSLHARLAARGKEPRHRKMLIENRGVPPTHADFYNHLHAGDSLLRFLDDDVANADPIDMTIGTTFEMRVKSSRWEHEDTYRLTRTKDGWHFAFMSIAGECDREGNPGLYGALEHDAITYPTSFPDLLERVWNAGQEGASKAEMQAAITALGRWLITIEESTPRTGLFSGW